jgi:choline transport protein
MSDITEAKDRPKASNASAENDCGHDLGVGDVQAVGVGKAFHLWSALGISYSVTSVPLSIGTYLSVSVGVGGSPVYFFGYIVAVVFNLCICASLAELAAVFPHSSGELSIIPRIACATFLSNSPANKGYLGQIYWTSQLAPQQYARGLSYLVGWLTAAGYFFWTAATFLITSELIFALVQICHSNFTPLAWHYYLCYLAIGLWALLPNTVFFKWYPVFLPGLVAYINLGSLFILIILLVRSSPKQTSDYVFKQFVNQTGWSSDAVVFLIGLLPGLTAINGFDSAAYMAEEMSQPARQVPQVMFISAVASAISGLPMILVYMFCITDPENLLDPIGGQPIIQLMVDSLRSFPLAIIGTLIFVICFACASVTLLTTFTRIWWSLAREGGVPFSKFMARISEPSQLPINSIVFSVAACSLIGLLELGSATALNAILGSAILCIFSSYAIPVACSLAGKRSAFKGPHYFDLGRGFGTVLNWISVVWIAFVFVWLCFPLYLPATMDTMNWAVLVFAVVIVVSGFNWLIHARSGFQVPRAI